MVPALDATLKISDELRASMRELFIESPGSLPRSVPAHSMPSDDAKNAFAKFVEKSAVFGLLGPDSVDDALTKFAHDCLSDVEAVRTDAHKEVINKMHKALKVKD